MSRGPPPRPIGQSWSSSPKQTLLLDALDYAVALPCAVQRVHDHFVLTLPRVVFSPEINLFFLVLTNVSS